MLTLEGRVALVTGGGRGIGRAISLLLARVGAKVAVNYRGNEEAASATVDSIRTAGGTAVALPADVSRPEEAARLLAETEARLGPLDVLVVNHGIWLRAPIDAMTPEQWDEMLRVNLGGAYAVCHHAARAMIPRRRGAIVTIASTAGQRGEPYHAHYAASKGAFLAFTKSLQAELAPQGIRVICVTTGIGLSDISRGALQGPGAADAVAAIPLGRPGTPDEIAGPVAFLASDLASYLYGEVLSVNGGARIGE